MKKLTLQMGLIGLMLALTSSDLMSQKKINFGKIDADGLVTGVIEKNTSKTIVLSVPKGKTLSAKIYSRNGCIKLSNRATGNIFLVKGGDTYLYFVNHCSKSVSFALKMTANNAGEKNKKSI